MKKFKIEEKKEQYRRISNSAVLFSIGLFLISCDYSIDAIHQVLQVIAAVQVADDRVTDDISIPVDNQRSREGHDAGSIFTGFAVGRENQIRVGSALRGQKVFGSGDGFLVIIKYFGIDADECAAFFLQGFV